jgi:hypothetical protein
MGQLAHAERVISPGWLVLETMLSGRAAVLKQKNMPLIHAGAWQESLGLGMDIEIISGNIFCHKPYL